MRFAIKQGSAAEQPCDVLVVSVFEGEEPGGAAGAVDRALSGLISETIKAQEFEGRLGSTLIVPTCSLIPAKKILVVGLGKPEELGVLQVMRASGSAARKCRALRAKRVASILHGAGSHIMSAFDCGKAVVLGAMLGAYEFIRLKTEKAKANSIESFEIVEASADLEQVELGMRRAEVIGDSIIFARDLGNEPSNVVTPEYLASIAQTIAKTHGMTCRVLDRKGIEDAGMGLLTAVARGTAVEPRFIEVKYESPGAEKTVAIVGKGITFDSGGYSLKTAEGMYGMKDDMSGAAAVLAAMRAVGSLKPKVNVLALVPATENLIGGKAIHPGDVFKSLDGKTVEINNTDAEGRLVLSDAVAHAVKQGVDEIVDAATLTGGCVVALGTRMSGIMGNDQGLIDRLIKAGESCGEKIWQLPLDWDYSDELKSDVADLKNAGSREAQPVCGALFIGSFVGETPWAHIDMSSAMTGKDLDLAKKGNTGMATGTFIEYILGQ